MVYVGALSLPNEVTKSAENTDGKDRIELAVGVRRQLFENASKLAIGSPTKGELVNERSNNQ